MPNYYDELEIEDFAWDPIAKLFHYPCPCGDRFEISKAQLRDGEEIAICPSCSLIVRVIYDYLDWEDYVTSDEEEDGESVDTPPTEISPEHEEPAAVVAKDDPQENFNDSPKDDSANSKKPENPDPDITEAVDRLDLMDKDDPDRGAAGGSADLGS
ncbi:diphthamide biosynthesis protein 3 [Kwoniella dejecticola CBS 10117]|uniref:Diphthamide biosynthesis protein 3 n=1 Tax=Kwoniella dejecticola CBS 10117 TaxID=1296121 RepID=A0A1A6A4I9_9TREE|nr:diphthamide biosynthesis protein 3 [Kwoniella dejecticola CBS 10117]OBR84975.1 diphthamide biosynthesis protein 3 [Kwoniella dejecticola CBS 10117]